LARLAYRVYWTFGNPAAEDGIFLIRTEEWE